jgi:bacterioferritin-associated ferredoxin
MNKAFVRELDDTSEYCPRCGSKGESVGRSTLKTYLTDDQLRQIADPANFCPSAQCRVAYFDGFERVVLTADIQRPIYPKDPTAPICACYGLTQADIEQDVQEGVVTRTKAILERAKSAESRCSELAANGRPCVAAVQKYYMQCRHDGGK